ncbi:MAG TPA: hypothetical protein VGE41_02730 [Verrucomicrobiae bacterium]|jgi:hypothetical protein
MASVKLFSFAAGLVLLSTLVVRAQITVDLELDQEQFLRDESLPLKVKISNRSGQALQLGKEADWLSFSVENTDGTHVKRLREFDGSGELTLDSAMVGTRRADIMPCFDLSKPGRYRVAAIIKVKGWDKEFISKTKSFDIVRGSKIWESDYGLPLANGAPEVRKYALQQANYLKRLMLYARITDVTENHVYRVVPLGPLVSFGRPEAQIDRESNLHVLFQTGARSFAYHIISVNGEISTRQTFEYTASRPVLKNTDDGKIIVSGGIRRPSSDDFPPLRPQTAAN